MVRLVTLSIFAAASAVAVLAGGGGGGQWPPKACPQDFQLELVETETKHQIWDRQCLCVNDWNPWVTIEIPPEWPCRAYPVENKHGQWECQTDCPPPPPHHSHSPGGSGGWKREQLRLAEGTPLLCPLDSVACPIDPTDVELKGEIECIHWTEDLYNCGGCTNLGRGVNCMTLLGVKGTSCVESKCEIYSCARGFTLESSPTGTNKCVKESRGRSSHDAADSL